MTKQTDLATIEFQVTDHVATVALNRPEKMNSFTEQMA
ncbi:MAG: enoyl-CoA hydratase/isomerase family protein, partial [Mycobacterium sp.]